MRKVLLLLSLCISSYTLFSQDDSLLKTFKYRIDRYRAINLNVSGGGQFSETKYIPGTSRNHSSAGSFYVATYTVKSTDKILLTTEGNISSSFSFNKYDNSSETNKDRNFSVAPYYSILNKWFSKKTFIELGADASANFLSTKYNSIAILNRLKTKQTNYSLALHTGIGKGRLENITDMQNALWLNKALEDVLRLSRPLTADELNDLGRTITKANNTRVLDTRKRTQFILRSVDTYFQEKGLISKTDINYFVELNDVLFFAFNNYRRAGSEKFIRFTPSIGGFNKEETQFNSISKYEQNPLIKSALLSIGLNAYKPHNLKHQNNYGASLELKYISYKSTEKYFTSGVVVNEIKYNSTIKQAGANLFFEHAIYPNTRTLINFNLQSESGYQDSGFYGFATFTSSINYFISYRTRVTCALGAGYNKNIYIANQTLQLLPDGFQLSANAGISVSL
ncbi:MAG TPA: hypothetical protein VF487_17935 [Chitinophagaceae bacterium]